jgi:ketosteroid isomerase-like protein
MKNHSSSSVLTADSAFDSPLAVLQRLSQAQNAHDADAMAACFAADYRSEQPAHPARAFRGADRVRAHWAEIFHDIPDLRSETLGATIDGDTAWAEVRWFGHKRDGSLFDVRGMNVFGIVAGQIAWGRLYLEPVEQNGEGLDASVRRVTRS